MDSQKIGQLICQRRKEKGYTQRALAMQLGVSDKAISKWERGLGCPDVGLMKDLAEQLDLTIEALLSGEIGENDSRGGNMKKVKFYVCPVCGNVVTATNEMVMHCCGQKLEALQVNTATDETHTPQVEVIEDDVYITYKHEMTKAHYLSFVAYVSMDRVLLIKLYPEQEAAVRFHKRGRGMLYTYCVTEGLFRQVI